MIDENVQDYDSGIHFWDQDGHVMGTLWCDKEGVLYFSGNMDESARLFLEFLNEHGFEIGGRKQPGEGSDRSQEGAESL